MLPVAGRPHALFSSRVLDRLVHGGAHTSFGVFYLSLQDGRCLRFCVASHDGDRFVAIIAGCGDQLLHECTRVLVQMGGQFAEGGLYG
jgi:hypothetical protein